MNYHQTSNISHTLVGNKIVDHSDLVGASPVDYISTGQEIFLNEAGSCLFEIEFANQLLKRLIKASFYTFQPTKGSQFPYLNIPRI